MKLSNIFSIFTAVTLLSGSIPFPPFQQKTYAEVIPLSELSQNLPPNKELWEAWVTSRNFDADFVNELQRIFIEMEDENLEAEIQNLLNNLENMSDQEVINFINANYLNVAMSNFYSAEIFEMHNNEDSSEENPYAGFSVKSMNDSVTVDENDVQMVSIGSALGTLAVEDQPTLISASGVGNGPIVSYYNGIENHAIDNLLYFLTQNQNADGSYGNMRQYEITFKIAEAFLGYGKTENDQFVAMRDFLVNTEPKNLREQALRVRFLKTINDISYQTVLNDVLAQQKNNGGFALFPEYTSDILTTLEVIHALESVSGESSQIDEAINNAIFSVLNRVEGDGSVHFEGNSSAPSYQLVNMALHYLRPFANRTVTDGSLNISVQGKINAMLSFLENQWNEAEESLENTEDVFDGVMTLRSLWLYNVRPDIQEALKQQASWRQNFDGSFGDSFFTTASAMQALAEPDVTITNIQSTGSLENGLPQQFTLTVENNGYQSARTITLHHIVDEFAFQTHEFEIDILPGQTGTITLEFPNTSMFIGDMNMKFFVNAENETEFSDNWAEQTFSFAINRNGNPSLPLYYASHADVSEFEGEVLVSRWKHVDDPNRDHYSLFYREVGQTLWNEINFLDEHQVVSTDLSSDIEYEVTVGVSKGQSKYIIADTTTVILSADESRYASSASGTIFESGVPFASAPIAGCSNKSKSDAEGNFSGSSFSNGSCLMEVSERQFPGTYVYDSILHRVELPPNGSVSDIELLTRLTEDNESPVITDIQIVGGTVTNGAEMRVSLNATDNISLKEADFYFWNSNEQFWYYIGTDIFELDSDKDARPYTWHIPEMTYFVPKTVFGSGFQIKAIAYDLSGNASAEFESSLFDVKEAYSVSGRVTRNSAGTAGIDVKIFQNSQEVTNIQTDALGNYTVLLEPGTYEIVPQKAGFTFSPESYAVSVSDSHQSGFDFTAPTAFAHVGNIVHDDGGALLDSPESVFVKGDHAYVASRNSDALEIVDVSDPENPTHAGSIARIGSTARIRSPYDVFVVGDYAFIASYFYDALEIVDVSDPENPTHVVVVEKGDNGTTLDNPRAVVVSGNYAYLASQNSDSLEIIDVSDPTNPVWAGALYNGDDGAALDAPRDIFVRGDYAYVVSYLSDSLTIIDISTPSSPVYVGGLTAADGVLLGQAQSVFVSGDYAYITSRSGDSLEIIDISDPTNPTRVGGIVDGDGGVNLNNPTSVYVSGNHAFVTVGSDDDFAVIDVSSPENPSYSASLHNGNGGASFNYPTSVFIQNGYAFVTLDSIPGALQIIDVSTYYSGDASIVVSPSSHNLGERNTDMQIIHSITVSNTGNTDVPLQSISLVGDSEFSLQNDTCSNITLKIQGSCTFEIVFLATIPGEKSADFTVRGTGVDAVTETVTANAIDASKIPSLTITEPAGNDDIADSEFTIEWTDEDTDDDALISFSYDSDNAGEDGVLIVENISEDDETDQYQWDTSGLSEGSYYVYAIIDDGTTVNTVYSQDPVEIIRNTSPSLSILEPDGVGDITDQNFTITWSDADPDDDADIFLYYDTNDTGADGSSINFIALSEDDETDQYAWDTSEIPNGKYFVYAMIDDGVNAPVPSYSSGTLTVSHNIPPTLDIVAIDASPNLKTVVIAYTDEDPDDNAPISFYYDNDSIGADGTLIIENIEEDDDHENGTDQYYWDASSLPVQEYYIYAVIDDGENDPVITYFPEPLLNTAPSCFGADTFARNPYTQECSGFTTCDAPKNWEYCRFDNTPPTMSGNGGVTLPVGSESTTLVVTTDEEASCRYDTVSGTGYASMSHTFDSVVAPFNPVFVPVNSDSSLAHNLHVSGLRDGQSYHYYVRCEDTSGNANTSDFEIHLSVENSGENSTLYEDGEDASDWIVFDTTPNTPIAPSITAQDGLLITESNGKENGFKKIFTTPNTTQFVAQWDWRLTKNHYFFLKLTTNNGVRFLRYRPEDSDCVPNTNGEYIYCGVGAHVADGNIHTITRNLQADMHSVQPDTNITGVTQILLRGKMEVDNILLKDSSDGGEG
ncbi:hypothetical protein IPN35_05950 [Candidatus Peregrinibacteria bacterium]|nr:MAG: hypothetical protein IPN35_05950 [Candidatus Peregrinibacteria bacterium]